MSPGDGEESPAGPDREPTKGGIRGEAGRAVGATERRSRWRRWIGRFGGVVSRTGIAVRGALGRRDGKGVFVLVTAAYLLTYLWAIRHLALSGTGGVEVFVVDDPLGTALEQRSAFAYETVAVIEAGPVVYLFGPVNLLLGVGLAALVGVTLAVSVVSWRGPAACRLGAGAGASAGLPGLVSGFACCGPQLLVVIGVQASAGVIAAMQWMVPLAVVSLLGTLLWVGSRVDPTAM
ncbi:hypothetical protein [Natronomonas sp.]|uniref:hypothetical protein n=1 Tax=Natronomonas sp. TaxID=2184060 RepID=UPI002639BCFC|nr:hypothetical protein [Natronomonas sp.]